MAHTIMEANKFQDLHSASWRPRRDDNISPSPSPSPKAGEDQSPISKTVSRESKFSFTQSFCSIQTFNELDEAYPHWGGQSASFGLSN